MLRKGTTLFFGLPDEAGRFHRREARVLAFEDGAYRVELRGRDAQLVAGTRGRAFFRLDRGFVSQEAHVDAVLREEPRQVVVLALSGAIECAEMRECYRVPAEDELIRAVADRVECTVLDVSPIGLGVATRVEWARGDIVTVQVTYGELRIEGACSVQSVQDADGKEMRYGLACLENAEGGTLCTGLPRICAQIQTDQMRRRPRKTRSA